MMNDDRMIQMIFGGAGRMTDLNFEFCVIGPLKTGHSLLSV